MRDERSRGRAADRGPTTQRGPFRATLARHAGKSRLIYVIVPKKLTPPITRAWARTPVSAAVDGVQWDTSIFRAKDGTGFLLVPKRVRGVKGEGDRVTVAFSFVDD